MNSTQHPSNNDVLGPPRGATNDECRPLAITRVQYSDGVQGVRSYWQPSPEELAALAGGALVCFEALGYTHPPVILSVDGVPS
jgi:hypothetical protein